MSTPRRVRAFSKALQRLREPEAFRKDLANRKLPFEWYLAALEWPFDVTGTHSAAWYRPRYLVLLIGLAFLRVEQKNVHRIIRRDDLNTIDALAGDLNVDVANVALDYYEVLWETLSGRMERVFPGIHSAVTEAVQGPESLDEVDQQMCYLGLTLFFQGILEGYEDVEQAFEGLSRNLQRRR